MKKIQLIIERALPGDHRVPYTFVGEYDKDLMEKGFEDKVAAVEEALKILVVDDIFNTTFLNTTEETYEEFFTRDIGEMIEVLEDEIEAAHEMSDYLEQKIDLLRVDRDEAFEYMVRDNFFEGIREEWGDMKYFMLVPGGVVILDYADFDIAEYKYHNERELKTMAELLNEMKDCDQELFKIRNSMVRLIGDEKAAVKEKVDEATKKALDKIQELEKSGYKYESYREVLLNAKIYDKHLRED